MGNIETKNENITGNIYSWEQGTAWTISMLIKMHQTLAHSNNSSNTSRNSSSSTNIRSLYARSMQHPQSMEHGMGHRHHSHRWHCPHRAKSTATDSQTINVFVWILMMTVRAKCATAKSNQNRRMNVINYACNYLAKGPFPGTCWQPMTAWYLC